MILFLFKKKQQKKNLNLILLGISILIEAISSPSIILFLSTILETLILILIVNYLTQQGANEKLVETFQKCFDIFPFPSISCNKRLDVVTKNTVYRLKECCPNFPSFTSLQSFFGPNNAFRLSKGERFVLDNLFKKCTIFLSYFGKNEVKPINSINISSTQDCMKAITNLFNISRRKVLCVFIVFLPKMDYFDLLYKKIKNQNCLLLRSISHELRTPVNGIIGSLLLLKDKIPNNILFSFLIAEKSSHLFLNFINTMIDYTSIKFDCFKLNQTTFSASDFAMDIYELFKEKAKISKLDFYVSDKLLGKCLLHSDYQRLSEVIIYLLQNAFEHTHKGFVILEMQNDEKKKIKFSIIDSGYGIVNSQIKIGTSISIQKNRKEEEETLSAKMYGLGYKASNLILKKLDSQLAIHSEVGIGTTASFSIRELILVDREERSRKEIFSLSKIQKIIKKRRSFCSKNDLPKTFQVQLDQAKIPKALKYFEKMNSLKVNLQFLNDRRNNSTSYERLFTEEPQPEEEFHKSELENNPIMLSIKTHTFIETKKIVSLKREMQKDKIKTHTTTNLKEQYQRQSSIAKFNNSINMIMHTILIVDDEPFNRFTLASMILKHQDLEVKEAPNGKVALEMVEIFFSSIKLIFMDINMPILDGYEATRMIKKFCVTKKINIPIIALTSFCSDTEKAKTFEAGMDDFCNKPMTVPKLNEYLEKYIFSKQKNLV